MRYLFGLLSFVSFAFVVGQNGADLQGTDDSEVFQEVIYVHTDREGYLVGETVWFKIYVLDREKLTLSKLSKLAYIEVLNDKNEPVIQQKVHLEKGMGAGSIYLPVSLKTSGYSLRAYTRWMWNFELESYFSKQLAVINPLVQLSQVDNGLPEKKKVVTSHLTKDNVNGNSTPKFEVSMGKDQYAIRDEVNIKIKAIGSTDQSAAFYSSLSVYRIDSIPQYQNSFIEEYLQDHAPLEKRFHDTLLIPEYEGHLISGKMSPCDSSQVSNQLVHLFSSGKEPQFYATRTDDMGKFQFVIKEEIRNPDIRLANKEGDCNEFILEDFYSDQYPDQYVPALEIEESDLEALRNRSLNMQIKNVFSADFVTLDKTQTQSNIIGSDFEEYKLDDYSRFPSVEETFREIVNEVSVRNKKDELVLRVMNKKTFKFYGADPLVLIDGIPVEDINELNELDPYEIEKIRVVGHAFGIGNYSFYGVIGVFTFSEEERGYKSMEEQQFSKYTPGIKFKTPVYDEQNRNSPKPDFRTLLYWDADLILCDSIEVKFHTSDIPGKYIGVLEGIGEDGTPGSASFLFEVK